MVGPADEAAGAEGRSYVRASHADRDQAIDLLKAAFVQGRLAKDEFDRRVGKVLASRTYGDLHALTTGIPAAAPRPGRPVPGHPVPRHPVPRRPASSRPRSGRPAPLRPAPGRGSRPGNRMTSLSGNRLRNDK